MVSLQLGEDLLSARDCDLAGVALVLGVDDFAVLIENHSPAAAATLLATAFVVRARYQRLTSCHPYQQPSRGSSRRRS